MISQDSLLVTLVKLVDRLPRVAEAAKRGRGRPQFYSDHLFLKALVIMIVRHLHTVHELLAVLAQPTVEMTILRELVSEQGRSPSRRTWERRLKGLPATLPAQIGCLGRHLVSLLDPWSNAGRAVAIDSTILRARGGQWHQKHREQGIVPHSSIDQEAHWTKSGWHGWIYGWKLHLVCAVAAVWLPLAATLTPANLPDSELAPELLRVLPAELRGIACIPLEIVRPAKKGIMSSKTFGREITRFDELEEAVATYTARAAEKLRDQDSAATALAVFIRTNAFNKHIPHYDNSCTMRLPSPTAFTPELIRCALHGLRLIYKEGYRYRKAGVYLSKISPQAVVQPDLFGDVSVQEHEKKARLMFFVDVINRIYGRDTLFFAVQGTHRPWRMQQHKLSPRFTTQWSEIYAVR